MSVSAIFDNFQITQKEYDELDKKFGDLCHFVAWQLIKKNVKNNFTDEIDDITQELRFSLVKAGCYYKRQLFLEDCLLVAKEYVKDRFVSLLLEELTELWKNRTRHGANRQAFGDYQEKLLNTIVDQFVPTSQRPAKNRSLKIDKKFSTYCKAIAWNCQKNLGKRISKERTIRSGSVSLSHYEFLQPNLL